MSGGLIFDILTRKGNKKTLNFILFQIFVEQSIFVVQIRYLYEKAFIFNRVYEKIKRYNANPAAVTGIMANMLGENDTFDYKRKQDGGGPGRGLFQFDSMRKNYNKYLKSKQLPDSENAQLYWAMDQIYGDPVKSELGYKRAKKLRKILEKGNEEEATTAFFEIFENPSPNDPKERQAKLNKRLEYIKIFKEKKKSGGGSLIERNPYNN